MSNPLESFKGQVKLTQAHPDIIACVQLQLIKVGLFNGTANGIVDNATLAAFHKFKQLEYLENPDILGLSTANALLQATEKHQLPKDEPEPVYGGIKAGIPAYGIVAADEPVFKGCFFTWGELTKNLTRIPENATVTKNLINLAEYLCRVRKQLGNRPITLTSAYRPSAVNRAVGGVSNSRHVFGDAADIIVQGLSPREVYRWLDSWHGNRGGLGDSTNFTHVDLRGYRARWNYGNA